ncbi:uncharacterized protein LOC136746734 [Amia ocellicauda]|uniref:uncharacterized protein LOC136746734 n=1 Tax=Amia ocellicauda TaxID=2972642 RepID=UPI003464260D
MENKTDEKKENAHSPHPETSTSDIERIQICGFIKSFNDSMDNYMEELFSRRGEDATYMHTLGSASSVRNLGKMDAPSHAPGAGDSAAWRDWTTPESSVLTEDFYKNIDKCTNTEYSFWPAITMTGKDVQGKETRSLPAAESHPRESLQILNETSTAATGIHHFIKDEQEQTLIGAPSSSGFGMYPLNILPLSHPYGTVRAQKVEVAGDAETSAHSHCTSPGTAQGHTDGARSLVDSKLDVLLPPISIIKPEPCASTSHSGDGGLGTGFGDYAQGSPQQLLMCKNELSTLPVPDLSYDSQLWCQSTGLRDHKQQHMGYASPGGMQNTCMIHGYPGTYSTYIG